VRWAGVAFLVYLAIRLAADDGRLSAGPSDRRADDARRRGDAVAQPEGLAGRGGRHRRLSADGDPARVWLFAGIYFVICYLSVGSWAYAGAHLRRHLDRPARIRGFTA
jgi:threonine/homoserine/homoserine lactone efflux protein